MTATDPTGIPGAPGQPAGSVDVHAHLWPQAFVEALRRRTAPPYLDGWTLHLPGEPAYAVDPADHDVAARLAREPADRAVVGVSLSAPLGIETLPEPAATELLEAWHTGARDLPAPFAAWASCVLPDPDLDLLAEHLSGGFIGLQVPATALATPAALERLAPVLAVCEAAGRPVLVHPGPAPSSGSAAELPAWWPAVVDYPAQLQAAWWAWVAAGRSLLPELRLCFVAGAGLAPAHHERFAARGGTLGALDPDVFVDTSSYGRQGVDALVRALGIDTVVLGSDRPYAEPFDAAASLGVAAAHAITVANPHRLLTGGTP